MAEGSVEGAAMIGRSKANIEGIVQGIGFRPFVYNLAREKHLKGYILNTRSGVEIDVEGDQHDIDLFFEEIASNPLPLCSITRFKRVSLPPNGYGNFEIRESLSRAERNVLLPPDICICEQCLAEMRDPADRRYRYPFINCTNCGPRYTIIEDVPYDRPLTSMHGFQMCDECLAEYTNPLDRRFHAQPNACPVCGPSVALFDAQKNEIHAEDPVNNAVALLSEGAVLAIKGLGGFHLAVDATNSRAVRKLRERKHREEKPLAIMSADLLRIREYARISPGEASLLASPQRPIVLLRKKEPNAISPDVAPRNTHLGVMLPYTPLHHLLLEGDLLALVMTSGNLSEEPIVIDNEEAFQRLGRVAEYFLVHNRDIYVRNDDSIVRRVGDQARMLRRSRGYVPQPIDLPRRFPRVLACGAELKNTICLIKNRHAFISQHIGDLKNLESYRFFQFTIEHLERILDFKPEIIAHDLHPDYLSTRYALEQRDIQTVGVQHHHAHIISCMTEHNVEGPVLGLAYDGTGYGADGTIWGGEVLLVEAARFERLAHLACVPMPGGDAAVRESWRMALSYLHQAYGENLWDLNLPVLRDIERTKLTTVLQMMQRGINSPRTSSLGRLFDAVAALTGLCYVSSYEGQAAVELEMAGSPGDGKPYPWEWRKEGSIYQIATSPLIRGVVEDVMKGMAPGFVSARFHLTLVRLFRDICQRLGKETGLDRVVLSGGVFQNGTLLEGLIRALEQAGFTTFAHSRVPTNDGGISLGQAAVAAARMTLQG